MPERVFGHIPGYPEGERFASRAELSEASVHRPKMAGISGSQSEGADSIVLSGAYEDEDVRVRDGADSYLIENGKIVAQTIHYTAEQK